MNGNIKEKLIDKKGFNIFKFLLVGLIIVVPIIDIRINTISIGFLIIFSFMICCFFSDHSFDKKLKYYLKWLIIFGLIIFAVYVICINVFDSSISLATNIESEETREKINNIMLSEHLYIKKVLAFSYIGLILIVISRVQLLRKIKNKSLSFSFGLAIYSVMYVLLIFCCRDMYDLLVVRSLGISKSILNNVDDGNFKVSHIINYEKSFVSFIILIAVMLIVILLITGSYYILTKKRRTDYQDIKDKYYRGDNSITVCTFQDVFNNMQVNLSWFLIYIKYRGTWGTMIEDGTFRLGEYLVRSYRSYRMDGGSNKVEGGDILYFSYNSIQAIFLSTKEVYEIIQFLIKRKKEGFIIHINENGLFNTELGKLLQESGFIFTKTSDRKLSKLGDRSTYIYSQAVKEVLSELGEIIEDVQPEYIRKCLENEYSQITKSFNAVGCFYHLMAIAQICIFTRGLNEWAKEDKMPIKNQREVTFGIMRTLQNEDIRCNDSEVCKSYYILKGIRESKGVDRNSILNIVKTNNFNVKYDNITELVVNYRNTFLGHGVMTYMVDAELVFYLLNCVSYILKVFAEKSADIDMESVITIKKDDYNDADELVPVYHKAYGKTYVYSKKLHNNNRNHNSNNAVYLDYMTGEIKCFDISDSMKEIIYDIEGVV